MPAGRHDYVRINVLGELAYRVNFYVQLFQTLVELATALAGLAVVFSYTDSLHGWTPDEMLALVGVYFIVGGMIGLVIEPSLEQFITSVRDGTLDFTLTKPEDAQFLVSLPVMLVIAAGLALIFKPSASLRLWALLAFLPAIFLAFLLRFLVEWTLAQAAFWTTRVSAINQVYFVLVLFLSGQIAPLSLFPRPIQILAALLPFHWMIGFPVELALGRLTPVQAATGLAAQAVWLAIGLVLVRIIWRAGIRIYSAVGA